jgi:hypothetical protein
VYKILFSRVYVGKKITNIVFKFFFKNIIEKAPSQRENKTQKL